MWLYNSTLCVPECNKKEFVSLDDSNFNKYTCKECSSVDSNRVGCSRCQNFTGVCLECEEGYEMIESHFCRKECQDEGWYWSGKETNLCLSCKSSCLRCSDFDGKCEECLSGHRIMDDGKSCEPYFPDKDIAEEDKPKLLLQYFDKMSTQVVSVFNIEVTEDNLPSNLEYFEVEISKKGISIPVQVAKEFLEFKKKRKITELRINYKQFTSASLKISSMIREKRRLEEETMPNQSHQGKSKTNLGLFSNTIKGINFYNAKNLDGYRLAGQRISLVINILMVLCMVSSLTSALILVNVSQMIGMMRLVNLDFPANILAFSQGFSKTAFTWVPNIVPVSNTAECNMAEVFFKAEYTCIGLENTGGAVLLILALILLNGLIFIILKLSGSQAKKDEWLSKLSRSRVIHFYLLMVQKDILLSALVRLSSQDLSENTEDFVIQITLILIYLIQFVTILVLFIRKKPSEEIPQTLKDHPSLEIATKGIFSHLDTSKTTFSVYYLFLTFIVDCVYPILILLGTDSPRGVVLIISAIFLVMSLFTVLAGPNRSRLLNTLEFFVNLLISISYDLLMF